MINLLSQDEKRKLLREYRIRLVIVVLWSIFALEILGALLFTPAYYTLHLSTKGLTQSILEKRAFAPEGADEAQKSLTKIKKEITTLKPSSGVIDVLPSLLFQEIIAQKPEGIELATLSFARAADAVSVQFSGTALTQEDLLAFRRNVKTNPRVIDFKYASSFITKKTDIDFSALVTFR